MRRVFAAVGALVLMTASALAAEAIVDGKIKQFDADAMTITLDDGKTYRLPAEMDISTIEEGMVVAIRYDSRDGVNQIMDMDLQ
jgi:Cu/Ag efflux protein CusF